MNDYAKTYRRKYEEKAAARTVRQIKRLIMMKLPTDILLLLIVAIVFPAQMLQIFKK